MADKDLAVAVEAARKRLGLSKRAYAIKVGISRQALYSILAGGGVDGRTLGKLCRDGGVRESIVKDLAE